MIQTYTSSATTMVNLKRIAKHLISFFLYYTGALSMALMVINKVSRSHPAFILFYHRFSLQKGVSLPPMAYLKSFERQISYLKSRFDIISMDDLSTALREKALFKRPSVVITIDDGFRDNYDLAFPVLKRLNVPATVYLSTGFIGSLDVPWVDRIAYALEKSSVDGLSYPPLFGERILRTGTYREKTQTWKLLYEQLLYLNHNEKTAHISKLLDQLEASSTTSCGESSRRMLSWSEVEEMSRNGIAFGAHTVSHHTLSKLDFEEAECEIMESKREIEKRLGVPAHHFAIPNGKDEDFTGELRELCRVRDFATVVTTNFGVVTTETDLYRLPRICPSEPVFVMACDLLRLIVKNLKSPAKPLWRRARSEA